MINPDHDCYWTGRHRTHLHWENSSIGGAGVPLAVLKAACDSMGLEMVTCPDPDDEYGELIQTSSILHGAIHDGCFFYMESATEQIVAAILEAVLDLHSHYFGFDIDWSGVKQWLCNEFRQSNNLDLKALPKDKVLRVTYASDHQSFFRRIFQRKDWISVEEGAARLLPR